ncbi:MAG TPA: alpha/beta hydrolase, partial [Pyrinomonadaceae bacterium]|nr:alpha/beta hydrolase [Pyrinomonadaceae bacterium]
MKGKEKRADKASFARAELKVFAVALVALFLTCAPPQAVAQGKAERAGRVRKSFEGMVDVGGCRLFVRCAGEGAPTVVMEAGLASPSTDWDKVAPEVSRTTRVCTYDRAGAGRSDAPAKPRAPLKVVEDLRALLARRGERPPFVLVGHSFGGLFAALYA